MPPPAIALAGPMRTGLAEALLTDAEDDSYDLSWLHRLPSDPLTAIRELRRLLEHDPDPIDRHFMFGELEDRLYRSRDVFSGRHPDRSTRQVQRGSRPRDLPTDGDSTAEGQGLAAGDLVGRARTRSLRRASGPPGIRRRPPQSTHRVPGQVGGADRNSTEGGFTEPQCRAHHPDDRGPRVRVLRRELRSCRGPWQEAEELPRLPPTRAHGRRRGELTDGQSRRSASGGESASGTTAQVG